MSCLHLTKTCTMPSQAWNKGSRVSRPHDTEYDTLQPGFKKRKRARVFGTLGDAVDGEAGRFHVKWDDRDPRLGSIPGPDKRTLHPDIGFRV